MTVYSISTDNVAFTINLHTKFIIANKNNNCLHNDVEQFIFLIIIKKKLLYIYNMTMNAYLPAKNMTDGHDNAFNELFYNYLNHILS